MKKIMRRFIPALSAAGFIIVTVSGCSNTYPKETSYGHPKQRIEGQGQSRAYQTQQQVSAVSHNNTFFAYDHELSTQVAAMHGVMGAIVMRTDRNAYAAVMVDNSASGTKAGRSETKTHGPGDQKNQLPQPYYENLYTNELASDFIGYVTVQDHKNLSHTFKQEIALKIRQLDPTVHDVYISANREFINQLNHYKLAALSGASLKPYVNEFNQGVTRIFGTKPQP
ncbi:hypothetical protein [Paenibacillus sp. GbtcB18]|uniref:hypothetical protein n=1 Tax=Paenibacillus sp. GbtcB18 TaxID=2824763 RepID=UPI001C2F266B|nr:hypothetical protein [Paenibacillus sp. GbtcB18]